MNYTKLVCEQYNIKLDKHSYMLFSINEQGLFQAHGSYGSFNFQWSCHGCKSFKHFILNIANNPHYLLGKIAKGDYFYADETRERWKKRILSDRRGHNIDSVELSKEEARQLWDYIEHIDYYSAEGCQRELYDNKMIWEKYCEPWYFFEPVVSYSPSEIYFAKEVMPIFADILKKEIECNI